MENKDCLHFKLGKCRVDHIPCTSICGIFKIDKTQEDYFKRLLYEKNQHIGDHPVL